MLLDTNIFLCYDKFERKRGTNMTNFFKLYLISAVVFLVFDLFWLGVVSKKMYQHFIGHLMGEVRITPAIIFYLIYLIGLVFFVLMPGIEKSSLIYTIGAGALFGFVCYATYDLTNLATLKNWPVTMTLIDLVWGTFVTAASSGITYYIFMKFFGGGGS